MLLENYLSGPETNNISGRIFVVDFASMRYIRIPESENESDLSTALNLNARSQKEQAHILDTFFGSDKAWKIILPAEVMEGSGVPAFETVIWTVLSLCLLP